MLYVLNVKVSFMDEMKWNVMFVNYLPSVMVLMEFTVHNS